MANPYEVLRIAADADDEVIRRRYLELIRQFSPEHHPEKFSAIRAAFEDLRDLNTRVTYRLFEAGHNESLDKIIEEITCQTARRRVPMKTLLSLARKP